ncbi:chromatin assembly factor 1 subunit B [Nematocida displodere]|uniref:Chromatin assembly factor 1 subunit B n=1 Tax=Nematocida displodere TaxID=1805483 RepID=A0A177EKX8_9MICR|nr:chromatin assembly factor 1 subunit B [Nematocida displodere]
MKASCEVVKHNLQFHQDAAVFSVAGTWREGYLLVATAGGDGCVRLWKYIDTPATFAQEFVYTTGAPAVAMTHLKTLARHKGSVNSVRFNGEGSLLLSAGDGGAVYLWPVDDVLQGEHTEEDLVYTGTPITVRESDNTDIYDVAWFNTEVLVGTSAGRVEVYALADKEASRTKHPERFRVLPDTGPRLKGKCLSTKRAHKDIVQGIAASSNVYATFGKDRSLKIFTKEGKMVRKFNKKSLITDKHTLFFRRLAFSPDGSVLYVPSGWYSGEYAVHLLKAPEFLLSAGIGPFASSPGNVLATESFLFVTEGRNVYLFSRGEQHVCLLRVVDCAFLPITDLCLVTASPTTATLLVSSSDGFLTSLTVHLNKLE